MGLVKKPKSDSIIQLIPLSVIPLSSVLCIHMFNNGGILVLLIKVIIFSDNEALLVFIPKGQKKKATALLQEFQQRAIDVTFNSDGVIYIDQLAIPGSNMFAVFPLLYKKQKVKNLKGYEELVTKIHSMGLSNLILSPTNSKVNKNINSKQIPSKTEKKSDIPWWYLGP